MAGPRKSISYHWLDRRRTTTRAPNVCIPQRMGPRIHASTRTCTHPRRTLDVAAEEAALLLLEVLVHGRLVPAVHLHLVHDGEGGLFFWELCVGRGDGGWESVRGMDRCLGPWGMHTHTGDDDSKLHHPLHPSPKQTQVSLSLPGSGSWRTRTPARRCPAPGPRTGCRGRRAP